MFDVIKILVLSTASFLIAMALTPFLSAFLFKHKLGKTIRSSETSPVFSALHQHKSGTPTMGGILIWGTIALLLILTVILSQVPVSYLANLNFLSRAQTYLPLGVFFATALVGLVDDWLNVRKLGVNGGGLSMRHRLIIYTVIAAVGAWWFVAKLGFDSIHIPFMGDVFVGLWYIPIALFILVATAFSVNEIDGLDGLSGGTVLFSYAAFGAIAFLQGKADLAALTAAIVGALLAFLWFNIPPARFFMGDTGVMPLGFVLGVIALVTNTVWLLPIIGLLFVLESLSVIVQLLSKKLRGGKKIFLSSPFHHHLEAIGWPESKIVMRFWIISAVMASLGLILALIDRIT